MSKQNEQEIRRRRTFAIISHPDAGKTTLTEKLLLYGGAIQLAVTSWRMITRDDPWVNLLRGTIATFGAAYMSVVLLEPLVDLGLLAAAKALRRLEGSAVLERRLHCAA